MPTLLYLPRFDESGAAPRYRVYQYFDDFKKNGFEITVKPLLDRQYLNELYFRKKISFIYLIKTYFRRAIFLTFNKSKYDVVLMDGELFPYVPYFLEKLFIPTRYIMDQDDAIFHTYDTHKSLFVRMLFGKKIDNIMRNCHHVIIGNSYVRDRARLAGAKQISVLPTVVDATKYRVLDGFKKRSGDETVIGWVGSPSTVKSLPLIAPVLKKLATKANIILYIIGANYTLDGVKTYCVDWKEGWSEEKEIKLTNEIDIGIMPLEDGPYQKGKCGFKLIKYMACEKPLIASDVGMNVEIVDHGKNGFIATSLAEWEKYLFLLIENPDLRKKLGAAGREKMLREYSLHTTSPIICEIVKQALVKKSEELTAMNP